MHKIMLMNNYWWAQFRGRKLCTGLLAVRGQRSWPLVGVGSQLLLGGGLEYNYKYRKSIPFHSVWPL